MGKDEPSINRALTKNLKARKGELKLSTAIW